MGILEQSVGARNRVGIVFLPARQRRYFRTLRSPGIDSKEWISPAYEAHARRYDNPIPNRFLAPTDCSKIPAKAT